jgi:hypothetical protein
MKDIIYCQDIKLYNFFKNNNIDMENQKVWDDIVHKDYCSHKILSRKDGIPRACSLKKQGNTEFCNRHMPKELIKCKLCNRNIKDNCIYCIYHDKEISINKSIINDLPFRSFDIADLQYNSINALNRKKSKNVYKHTILPPLPEPDMIEFILLDSNFILKETIKRIIYNAYYIITYPDSYIYTINYSILYYKKRLNSKKNINSFPPMLLYKKKSWKSLLNGVKDFKFKKYEINNNNVINLMYNK